ncbi:FAD binding domain-containing protein [Sarocladium implicatum]|nr:FAD binding domain-containing protein [Sarocladium implicatum]
MLKGLCLTALLAARAHAAPTCSIKAACDKIDAALPADRTPKKLSLAYTSEMLDYWSVSLRDENPACMVLPHNAEEVATVVKILNEYPDVPFAVKSGGHSPNLGHATAKKGVLISTAAMKGATYDKETGYAHVKPGGEWNDVIGALDEQGVTVLGGRLGVVGVGGLLLGGGLSFLSSQHGMAADSIVEWELVTANGTVRHVKASEEPELAVALRGSGSQFGIVTEFVIQAYPRPAVWGGSRTFVGKESVDAVLEAIYDFTAENKDDPKAAIIPTPQHLAPGSPYGAEFLLLYLFYDGPEPPKTGPLAKVLEVPAALDATSTQSYSALLKANGETIAIDQSRQQFRTYTLPYVADVPDMYLQINDKLREIVGPVLKDPLRLSAHCGIAFQPLPAIVAAESKKRGGNAMGLEDDDGDRIVLEMQCGGWTDPSDDAVFADVTRSLVKWLDDKVVEWTGEEDSYMPLYINDAAWDQNVTGSYRDYAKLKALQEEADPEGLWSERGGGFTY